MFFLFTYFFVLQHFSCISWRMFIWFLGTIKTSLKKSSKITPKYLGKKKRTTPGSDDCPTGDVQLYQLCHLGMKTFAKRGGGLTYNWILDLQLGGGFKYFLSPPLLGEMIQFHKYFSNGLRPPARTGFGSKRSSHPKWI